MPKKVFISYAHESETLSDQVLNYSNYLRSQGIDAEIDQYEESPPEGWPKWMMRQVQEADFVLIVCTELFFNRANDFSGNDDGLGVKWETSLILQQLYSMNTNNSKFIPVIFDKANTKHIPLPLQPYTYYLVSDSNSKKQLTDRLKGISTSKRPPLGTIPEEKETPTPLEPKKRKSMFFSTIIDVEKWNKAKWAGMVFLSDPSLKVPPLIGFMFENEEYGEQIFSDLKAQFGNFDKDEEIHLSFIRGISDKEPQNYIVHLGTSHGVIMNKVKKHGLDPDETLFVGISRCHMMTPPAGSKNLDVFENSFNYFKQYGITNVIKQTGQIELNYENIIGKKNLRFTTKTDVQSDKNDEDQPAFAEGMWS
jgi:hypothetical protein